MILIFYGGILSAIYKIGGRMRKTTKAKNDKGPGFSTDRIEALTDGIFAIAMTLLVLTLELPDTIGLTSAKLHELIISQYDKFFNYALSFILLAVFWIIHHQQYHHIRKTDHNLLWLNIFTLIFVALMPFSTSLIGDFGNDWLADLFFNLNMFMLGILFSLTWIYAALGHRLVSKNLEEKKIIGGIKRGLIVPAVSLIAIAVGFLSPGNSGYAYLLIPVIHMLPYFRG